MATVIIKEDLQAVAEAAAEIAVRSLKDAMNADGQAVWVLAGGTAPMDAYRVLAKDYATALPWEQVRIIIGDERCAPASYADSNWLQVSAALLDHLNIPEANKLSPAPGLVAEKTAKLYEAGLAWLPQKRPGIPRLDHVWLGMGEDGHTLSLFPGNSFLAHSDSLVVPVHNAPKPPPDRMSLTLRALQGAGSCLIMASGAGKAEIVNRALAGDGDATLPIVQAVATIEAAGGQVTWLLDQAAARLISPAS